MIYVGPRVKCKVRWNFSELLGIGVEDEIDVFATSSIKSKPGVSMAAN